MPKPNPEDLLSTVIEADDLRRKARGQPSTRAAVNLGRGGVSWERLVTEPFFNVLGHLWGFGMMGMPATLRRPFVQWVNIKMGKSAPSLNPELPGRIQETVQLARDLKVKTGQWPACLILTSHPDTEGPSQWLRFELMRQGLQIADAVVEARRPGAWYPDHPQCLLAIDPYALDTISAPVAGFYSSLVHRLFLAWDRQPTTQSWLQKHVLLRGTDYSHIAWRLLRSLRAETPVLMVLAGGLPYNARLLYAAREFVHHLPVKQWRLHRREAHIELMKILMKQEGGLWPPEHGELPAATLQTVAHALERWGLRSEQVPVALEELKEEFKRPVPYRTRLFRVLFNRLVARGKPLLLVTLSHGETAPYVCLSSPVAVTSVPSDPAAFARTFVTSHF